MYTDGSKTETQTACAIIMMDTETLEETENWQYALHPETSAYEAEIYALYKAISTAHARDLDVVIYTDSKSAIKAITAVSNKENLNRVSKQTIQRAASDIRLAWIPGHVGIIGNERADSRARQEVNQTDDRHTPPCESLVRRAARKEIERRKKREWEEERTFLSKHWKETTPPNLNHNLPRWLGIKLFRLRTGHTLLTHMHLYRRGPQPGCTECQTGLTIEHILTNCQQTRRTNNNNPLPPLPELLSYQDPSPLISLLQRLDILKHI